MARTKKAEKASYNPLFDFKRRKPSPLVIVLTKKYNRLEKVIAEAKPNLQLICYLTIGCYQDPKRFRCWMSHRLCFACVPFQASSVKKDRMWRKRRL